MKISAKLSLLMIIAFICINIFAAFLIGHLYIQNREHSFNAFADELLKENTYILDESASMFFELITMKFLSGASRYEVLEYIKEIDQLNRYAAVFDYEGNSLLSDHSDPELETFLTKDIIEKQLLALKTISRKNFSLDNYHLFKSSISTVVPRKVYYQVYNASGWIIAYGKSMYSIRTRLDYLKRQNDGDARTFLLLMSSTMLIGIAILIFSVLMFTRKSIFAPLADLVNSFDRVAKGDLNHRIEAGKSDEIGELSKSFNNMAENLSNKVHEIRAVNIKLDNYSRTLESRVERRTKELSETVAQMEQEIKDRKRAEERLFIRDLAIQQSIDGVAIADLDGTLKFVNTAWGLMHGLSPSDIIGKNMSIHFTTEQLQYEFKPFIDKLKTKGANESEIGHLHAGGSTFPTWMSAALLKDENGGELGLMAIARDISETKAVENQLRDARLDAEAANLAKSQFLANMSHEIRTPMNAIIGMTDLIIETELTPEQEDYIATLKSSADSLLNLLNDILDLSKIEVGKLDVENIEFNFRDCIADTIRNLSVPAQSKNIELIYDIPWNIPDIVCGDPSRLRQILTNLIGNSIKFTSEGHVVLKINRLTDEPDSLPAPPPNNRDFDIIKLHFSISDTGIGIPLEKQELIFDKFTQTDSSITRKFGGTGLGLTICRQLVQLMDGEIWVKSPGDLASASPGNPGSTFYFTLTLQVPHQPTLTSQPASFKEIKGVSALVVDDNPINREIYRRMLTHWGMVPQIAGSGKEGIDMLNKAAKKHKPFEVVLMDIQMPDMSGFDAIEIIRKEIPIRETHIIVLTSSGAKGDGQRCRDLGVSAYLKKPVPSGQLLEALLLVKGSKAKTKNNNKLITRFSLKKHNVQGNILVAEDNLINQKLIKRLLEKRGFLVDIANNGREVVKKLSENTYDLILMDIQMPEMDGVEATRVIRAQEKEQNVPPIPIVALTAHAMKGDKERFLEAGMNSYISKPIKQAQLMETLSSILTY